MNKIQRMLMNIVVKRQMKKLNIPFGKGEDVVARAEAAINKARAEKAEQNKGMFDSALAELPLEIYEVLSTCDTCNETDILGGSHDLYEALDHAKKAHDMVMNDDNVLHIYRSAVVKVSRELVYSPEQVAQEKELDNK